MKLSGGQLLRVLLLLSVGVTAVAQEPPAPTLFEVGWHDRSGYAPGLHPAWAHKVPELTGAPVYHLDWRLENPTRLRARQEVLVTNYSTTAWEELNFLLHPTQLGGRMFIERLWLDGERVNPHLLTGNTVLRVALPAPLAPGEAAVVGIDYRLEIPESGGGNYGILAFRQDVLSLAHAYALLAVYDEDGWDLDRPPRYGDLVYARSSFFRVRFDAPAELEAAASGRRIEEHYAGDRQRLEFVAGPVRDFYLFAAEEIDQVLTVEDGIIVRGHALPGTEPTMERAVEDAARALEIFGELYGHYPFRELDIVPIVTSALGVEFPGIIALRVELLDEGQGALLESTVVHEVAHQWFYSLVGNDQVSEPWLDESVTQYLTLRYYLEAYGQAGYGSFRRGLLSRWESVDRERIPVGMPVVSYSSTQYGAIIYGLGPLVVEMLGERLGPGLFDRFLRDYTREFGFEVATTADFRSLAEAHCDCSLDEFFEEWIAPPAPLP